MPLALTEDHLALAEVAGKFLTDRGALTPARSALESPDPQIEPLWKDIAGMGWLGLHLPTRFGGDGYGLPESAVVAEQIGRVVSPLPFLSSVVTSAAIDTYGTDEHRQAWLPGFVDGTHRAALGLHGGLTLSADATVTGNAGAVTGTRDADLFCLRAGDDLVLVRAGAPGLDRRRTDSLDPTLGIEVVSCSSCPVELVLTGAFASAARAACCLGSAEAAGGAQATLEAALSYAKVREQFGRPIGSFQAVKHHLANMFIDSELAVAASWDAARAEDDEEQGRLASDVAGAVAYDAFVRNAEMSLQIHGGIGFTWDHDCHLYLRRAQAIRTLYGRPSQAREQILDAAAAGVRRRYSVELPPEAEQFRTEARAFRDRYTAAAEADRRPLLVDSGYLTPHWAKPFGRAAGPVEQLVIDEELSDIDMPDLGIGGWVILTVSQHSTPEQLERWIRPSLLGDLAWCQLFSEPGAGSDAAAVSSRGIRVDGGWRVTGQKVWTSNAQACNRGLATIRTNRDAPKHKGITTMVVDLTAPGVTVRPLREITGEAVFNEVFFDDVFVPDSDVVGEVDAGWTVARATLGNERISIGGGPPGRSAFDLVALSDHLPVGHADRQECAALLAEEQVMRLLNLRHVIRAVTGGEPGPEGSVTKLVSAEHLQRITEAGIRMAGEPAITGSLPDLVHGYLMGRAMTIAGGTSEINRNVIAERVLGLPREQIAR